MLTDRNIYRAGRLTTKHIFKQLFDDVPVGMCELPVKNKKENLLYVPKNYHHNVPAGLALMLHGAGGNAHHGVSLLREYADTKNIILMAPASVEYSWDIIATDGFGPDVILIDQALSYVVSRYVVDASHIAIGGFSDGASYALSLGLGNGDLFTHIIAFSPGFYYTYERKGNPKVFISHGTDDNVLPITPCSRRIVKNLQGEKADVVYKEFNGRHEITPFISDAAIGWFLE